LHMRPGEKAGGGTFPLPRKKLLAIAGGRSRDPQKTAENLYSLSPIANTGSLQVFCGQARKRPPVVFGVFCGAANTCPPDFLWEAGRGLYLGSAARTLCRSYCYCLRLPRIHRPVPKGLFPWETRVPRGLFSGCALLPTPPAPPQVRRNARAR
jgi:hypothetical protein